MCRPGTVEYRLGGALALYNERMELIRILIFCLLAAILASLGTAFYHLSTGKGDSNKMLRALTWRIALSIALFVLLMIAWRARRVTSHSFPTTPPSAPGIPGRARRCR